MAKDCLTIIPPMGTEYTCQMEEGEESLIVPSPQHMYFHLSIVGLIWEELLVRERLERQNTWAGERIKGMAPVLWWGRVGDI